MAELILFGYRQDHCLLHTIDARVKLAVLVSISTASLQAGPLALCLATIGGIVLLVRTRFALAQLAKELRYFLILLFFVFIARALTTPGESVTVVPWLPVSRQGLSIGMLLGWRLLIVAIMGVLLTATTRPAHIRSAVEWYLRPIPLVPHRKVATMIGLLVRFIPVILAQSAEISEALRARAFDNRKNPIRRTVSLCMPLLRRTFITADRLALAMEARCYGPDRTAHQWRMTARDWSALGLAASLCALMMVL
jgi:energy-coupling factor transporter transmembrane protein EcfT